MDILVGYTGFVGSNLSAAHDFSLCCNRKNIQDAFETKPDCLIYSGVPAEMFLANKDPEVDRRRIDQAIDNIKKIQPKQIVLISTVAVYPNPQNADEDTALEPTEMTAYGLNRYILEQWVENNIPNHLIVRLPAIFGVNLKKNFLFDYIHRIPTLLTEGKFVEFCAKEDLLTHYYVNQGNGFYKYEYAGESEEVELKECFSRLGFSALNFTDSRSKYQFYWLKNLWNDLSFAIQHGIQKLNLVTPPIQISDLYQQLEGKEFCNELSKPPFDYDLRTKYSELFGRKDGYIMDRAQEMQAIREFLHMENKKRGLSK